MLRRKAGLYGLAHFANRLLRKQVSVIVSVIIPSFARPDRNYR